MPGSDVRDAREPSAITIPIIVQDPHKTPNPVNVTVRGPLLAGPIGERMAVFDYNVDRDVVFAPATPRKDGSFPDYELDDMRFHQLNTYAIAARATELVELELGRPLRWGFEGSRLLVVPHAGTLENAFYSAESHSLQFYSFMGNGRRRRAYHTALAHDIVAHETGHAVLDAVRPRYYEPFEPETSALHEAVGDLCAIFAALSHDVIRRRVVGSLDRLNLLSEIAEGFEEDGARGLGVDPQPGECHAVRLEEHVRAARSVAQALEHYLSRAAEASSNPDAARTVQAPGAAHRQDRHPADGCPCAGFPATRRLHDRRVRRGVARGGSVGASQRRRRLSRDRTRRAGRARPCLQTRAESRRVALDRVPAQLAASLGARRLSVPERQSPQARASPSCRSARFRRPRRAAEAAAGVSRGRRADRDRL